MFVFYHIRLLMKLLSFNTSRLNVCSRSLAVLYCYIVYKYIYLSTRRVYLCFFLFILFPQFIKDVKLVVAGVEVTMICRPRDRKFHV